jgi:co-chaperonin GroES (HSP10)
MKRGAIHLVKGEDVYKATVLAVGPGKYYGDKRVKPDVKPGDIVVFHKDNMAHKSGKALVNALSDFGEDIILIKAGDILCVVDPDTEITL